MHLLVDYTYYPEGGGLAILAPDSNILVELTPDPNAEDPMAIPLFGDVAWKPDSTSFFIGSAMVYYGAPGLALVDAGTGVATGILTSPQTEVSEEAPLLAVRGPYWTTAGGLRAYVSEQAAVDVPAPYSLEEIDPATGERTPLNAVTYPAPGVGAVGARRQRGAAADGRPELGRDANGRTGQRARRVPSVGGRQRRGEQRRACLRRVWAGAPLGVERLRQRAGAGAGGRGPV